MSKLFQSGGFVGAFLGKLARPLMKVGLPLTKNLEHISYYDIGFYNRCCKSRKRVSMDLVSNTVKMKLKNKVNFLDC